MDELSIYQKMINNSKFRMFTVASLVNKESYDSDSVVIENITTADIDRIVDMKIIINLQDVESVSECVSCAGVFEDDRPRIIVHTVTDISYLIVDYTIESFYALLLIADNIGNVGRMN